MAIKITKQQVAEMLRCGVRTVSSYQSQLVDPLPHEKGPKGGANFYDAVQVHEWDLQRRLKAATPDESEATPEEMGQLDYERWRKTKAEATAQEMKNQVTRRELAPVALLEVAIEKFAEQAKSVFESIPLKVKKKLPHLKASEVELVKREIVKVQNAATKISLDWSRIEDSNK